MTVIDLDTSAREPAPEAGEPSGREYAAAERHYLIVLVVRMLLVVAVIAVVGSVWTLRRAAGHRASEIKELSGKLAAISEAARDEQEAWNRLRIIQAAHRELSAWNRARPPASLILADITAMRPPAIELTRLSVASTVADMPAAQFTGRTGTVVAGRSEVVLIQGRILGKSVDPAVDYGEKLGGTNVLGALGGSIVLQGITRESQAADSDGTSLVGIEAKTAARPVW